MKSNFSYIMKKKSYPIWLVLLIVLYQCSFMVRPSLQDDQFSLPEELQHFLPSTVIPERYEVIIEHYLDETIPHYSGEVRIQIRCTATRNNIILNQAGGIHIRYAKVKLLSNANDNQPDIQVKEENHYAGNQWELVLDRRLVKNKRYEVFVSFYGPFHDTEGYILKTYGEDSNQKFMAFTKLNEFDARKVIPCLDQINMKAKFKMWLLHPKRFTSFSNAAVQSMVDINTEDQPNWIKVEFHETDYMATFSMAMALAQFETTAGLRFSSNEDVQIWSDEKVIHRMNHINELVSQSLNFFTNHFKLPHPLKKLDILILPGVEFEIEESFGIIFMSEKYVLEINPLNKSRYPTTYETVLKICHAVSYQWIGSTVTMTKWKDTWFHQGLNYFLQKECAKEIFPEYPRDILHLNMITSFLDFMRSEEMNGVYGERMMLKSYPKFDIVNVVTIEKVYHLIRMVKFIMGPKLFKKGLRKYVLDFKGRNSDVDQALNVFTKTANSVDFPTIPSRGFEIQKIMKSWLDRIGVPLVVAKRDDSKKKLNFHQAFFKDLDLSKQNEVHVDDRYWLIPLSCTTEKELKFDKIIPRVWLNNYQQEWGPQGEFDKEDWFLCNLEFNVPGRVLYDKETWNSIRKFLIDERKFKKINVLTRARLVSDMFTLAEAGALTYEIVLRTMEYLQYEEELIPWMIALKEFDRIRSRLLGRDLALLEQYERLVRMILKPGYHKLIKGNFLRHPEEHSLENEFQILFTEISCKFDFDEGLEKRLETDEYNTWRRSSNVGQLEIEHRLSKVVLCEQVKYGNRGIWDSFWDQYVGERRQSWKEYILPAFGCLKEEEDLKNLLKKSINDEKISQEDSRINISREDSIIIFQSMVSNKKGYLLMKDFFLNFYGKIKNFHSEGEPSVLSYLRILFDATNERSHYDEILHFAKLKMINLTDANGSIIMDNAKRNIIWGENNRQDLQRSLGNTKLKKFIETMKNKKF